jgi:hypothetical protein
MSEACSTRTTRSSIRFTSPFCLGNDDEVFPAGLYDVLTTEAVHEGNERTVYQRISTVIIVVAGGTTRYREVAPSDLDEAARQHATV